MRCRATCCLRPLVIGACTVYYYGMTNTAPQKSYDLSAVGFRGYRVVSDGRVQTQWRRGTTVLSAEWRDLKPRKDSKGYHGVCLCNAEGHYSKRIHRIVALAFIPNPSDLPCVCHIDGNPDNNNADNLKWGSYLDNENDKRVHGTWRIRCGGSKLSDDNRRDALASYASGESQKSIATRMGVSRPTITRLLNGSTWKQ